MLKSDSDVLKALIGKYTLPEILTELSAITKQWADEYSDMSLSSISRNFSTKTSILKNCVNEIKKITQP